MESRKTLLSLRWLSNSESLARIVGGQLGGGRRLAVCALLLCVGFHFLVSGVHAQGPGLYKDGKKVLDLGEMVDSSFQSAAAPRLEQTAGMKLFREVYGEKMPLKDTPQKKYIRLVLECRDIVERIASYRDSDSAFIDGIGRLLVLEERLLQANKLLLDKFGEIEESLKDNGYPAEKIDRHAEVVEGHTIAANRLSELLANLRSAHDSNDQASLEVLIQELKQYFIDNVFRKDPPLLSSQPLPVMMQVKEAPVVEDQLPAAVPYPRILKGERGPQKGNLDPTIDVQFTDDIISLAASLNNSPVEMYNYVRDNFEFEAYLGSRKGSQQTLDHRSGNDYDQASLLIALLRVSGIPARYAKGEVRMTIEQATNWLGIQDKRNAGSILTTCGMEGIIYIVNDDTVAISCRRVWVETWLPFINYRGAINDSTGFMWVPMDPTFKQYEYTPGINLPAEIGFDAEALVWDYISTLHAETPVEMFKQMLLDSLAIYHPGATYDDLITTRSVIKETDGILPGTLPYTLISMDGTFSEIASEKRYYIRFHVYGSGTDLDYTISLPEIAGKQLTISWVGATAGDQEIIDTAQGFCNIDIPYLVDLIPVLNIDGCEVARGTGQVMMGLTVNSDMHFTAPTGAQNQIPVVHNTIIAGNYQGIGIDTEDAFPSFFGEPETACEENTLGQEQHQLALTYLNKVDMGGDDAADLMYQVVINDVSEAIVENSVTVLFSGGLPVTFECTGMTVDADRKIVGPFSVDGVDNDCDYMRLAGADASIQENRLFEDKFGEEAISAIKILELASDSGITVCKITYSIAAECPGLNQPPAIVAAINNALAQGHHVIIPERGFKYYEWTGTGYIDIDPATCAAGYIISGGHNGGATVWIWIDPWFWWFWVIKCKQSSGEVEVTPPSPNDLYCADSWAFWTFTVPTTRYYTKDEDGNCLVHHTETNKHYTVPFPIRMIAWLWGPGEYVFSSGGSTSQCSECTGVEKVVKIAQLEITDCPSAWLPQGRQYGTAVDDAGNSVDFTVKVKAGVQSKIRFHLEEVSSEPGVCINYGDESGDTPDLKFIQTGSVNPSSVFDPPSADGMTITTKDAVSEATVTVTCYDWGAWGKIKACCVLDDGAECGCTESKDIPVDNIPWWGGNHIADAWEPSHASEAATWDDDATPSNTNRNGDGYSFYEEYRGTMEGFVGTHTRLDPDWKELFIYDQDLLHLNGHDDHKFIFLTSILIYYVNVDPAALMNGPGLAAAGHRVINHKSEFATLHDQFALHVRDFTLTGRSDWGLVDGPTLGPPETADPLVKIDQSQIGTDLSDAITDQGGDPSPGGAENAAYVNVRDRLVTTTTTHEMGHGCAVSHHASADGGRQSPYGNNYSGEIMCVMRYDFDLVDVADATHVNMYGLRTAANSPPGTVPPRFEFSNYTDQDLSDLTPVSNVFCTGDNDCRGQIDVKDD